MMMANQFAGSTLIQCDFEVPGVNATAYAAKTQDGLRIALFNKDANHDLTLVAKPAVSNSKARVWRLTGPALDSTSGVTLADAEIQTTGVWHPKEENLEAGGNGLTLHLPRASTLLAFVS